ncbi:hypothetical protein E2C01_029389 [Portunus trituberculatus]|uniref:Uncharacterized protein n=1 Tax=Portunus trituberculatus TaxID=210409 RepID=A0A5B7ES33_PORTR|nr:hypothetical protein [Portunus trituberculatus]
MSLTVGVLYSLCRSTRDYASFIYLEKCLCRAFVDLLRGGVLSSFLPLRIFVKESVIHYAPTVGEVNIDVCEEILGIMTVVMLNNLRMQQSNGLKQKKCDGYKV